ncbi:MAG TPA: DUF2950 domain-containing protein [bacterium]|nr:DUF2950 domain-containing protein [bacterium]
MIRRSLLTEPIANGVVVLGMSSIIALLCGCSTAPTASKEASNQSTFATPERAVQALASAAKNEDKEELLAIFGPESRDLLSSGDPVADRHNREVFSVAMEQQWKLENVNDRYQELVIGNEEWPFPIPLVKERAGWRFDTAAGKQEVLARRIGRNELAAISICRTYVIAQKEYASQGHDGKPAGIYAQKVRSTPGKQDGLYWDVTEPGGQASPLSELAAQAEKAGYSRETQPKQRPFYGYFFRILTQQGPDAPGEAKNYIVNGELKNGFALLACPAEYGNSGIMSFIVNQEGIIYERDLGSETAQWAAKIQEYNPDTNWNPAE